MQVLPLQYALWRDLAECVSAMEFRIGEVEAPTSVWWYRYDSSGDLVRADLLSNAGSRNFSLRFYYAAPGQLLASTLNAKPGAAGGRSAYTWVDGVLTSIHGPDGERIAEVVGGVRVSEAMSGQNGSSWTLFWTDEQGLVTVEEHIVLQGEAFELHTYDNLGRLAYTQLVVDGQVSREIERGYDQLGRALWKNVDNDANGTIDTRAVWRWWCE